jgi:hypothetical protein
MSDELSLAQKLEMVRTALPKGLSAGDSGLGGLVSKPPQQSSAWPQFTSSTSESKIYTTNPTTSQVVQPQSNAAKTTSNPHPWQIRLVTNDEEDVFYLVEYNSNLYAGLGSYTNVTVTGLDSEAPVSEGYVVLTGTVVNGACSTANVNLEGSFPERIEFNEDVQTKFSAIIGYLYQDENDAWTVRQNAFHNFTLFSTCVNGMPAIYPIAT